MMHYITDNRYHFFVDESAKDRNSSRRKRRWLPIGFDEMSELFSDHNEYHYTLIAAADLNGFVIEACDTVRRRRGAGDVDMEAGTVDTNRFVSWIEDKFYHTLGNFTCNENCSTVHFIIIRPPLFCAFFEKTNITKTDLHSPF
jgi:hypothetical protein